MRLIDHCPKVRIRWTLPIVSCAAALSFNAAPVHAGVLDALFGKNVSATGAQATAGDRQRFWRVREFSGIALVDRESGAAPNQSPVSIQPAALRQQLALIQFGPPDRRQALFAEDEAADVSTPLAQALNRAGANDDVVLASSSRRDAGFLFPPTAVTARVFVQGGAVQFIVRDARFDFYDTYRGTHQAPDFSYGSRTSRSAGVALSSAGASAVQPDWIAIPLSELGATSAAVPAAKAAPTAPAATPMRAEPPAAAAPMATPPAPRQPLDAAGSQDIERRLETLKRLYDRKLINEDEYLQKRKEILQSL